LEIIGMTLIETNVDKAIRVFVPDIDLKFRRRR
jgi:hypothetical protein